MSAMSARLRIVSCLKQSYRSYKQKCNTISFCHKKEEKKFEINLRYVNPNVGIDKVFNFTRNENERVDACLDRIRKDVRNEIVKKSKKNHKKPAKSSNEESDKLSVSVKLVRNGELIRGLNLLDLSSISKDIEFFVMDQPFAVAYNSPVIFSITLPSTILAKCFVYPSKIEMHCSNPKETTYAWYREQKIPNDEKNEMLSWTKIGNKSTYLVRTSDVGHKLKLVCTPRNGLESGSSAECVSTSAVEAKPGVCLFERRHLLTQVILPNDKFRVVTYNLLADLYADSDFSRSALFPYCPPYALAIDYRKQLFMKEIAGYNGDIICLQEVDSKIFDSDLLPLLQSFNYIGTFKPKRRSDEGLATFFNSNKFSLVRSCSINIGENINTLGIFEDLWRKIKKNEALVQRITERSQVVQVTTIKAIDSSKIVMVANTHLFFRPDAEHIRLLQMAFCLKYVEYVYHQTKQESNLDGSDISIVFCGDFNSVPERGLFKLMTQKHVEENHFDFRSNATEGVKDVSLSQPFEFKSAYEINPKYTNFTVNFSACLDYIFYQPSKLNVIQTVPVPSEEELRCHTAIPSVVHPSDHIALIADFEWLTQE